MRFFASFLFLLAFCVFAAPSISAQETEDRVVDEVVAVVNDGVITLSKISREAKSIVDTGVQAGKKREDAEREVEEKRGELIANLIHEELLIQKAKELGFEAEIDANVNRRFLDIMKQYNLKTLDQLYAEMEKQGVDPNDIRDIWKKQATRDLVLQKEVQAKLYWGASAKELKDYYEAHKAKFTKPETVTVSEIFLGFAGRDEAAVREKGKQLVAQLRAGGDFDKLAKENSDPGVVTQNGKPEKLKADDMAPMLSSALKDVKVGGYTEPVAADQVGIVILRVDAREKATSESYFDENAVRLAIVGEKAPDEQKKFYAMLRSESYIKINDRYRPIVAPILYADDRKDKPSAAAEEPKEKTTTKEVAKKTGTKEVAKEKSKKDKSN
ncbi:MAG: hypothetical protein DMF63_07555 [Acidobacteria bacterium]|nr:MAG: hypothetical protein DMF63_07555 [Acidobacteriota bacterium]